MKLTTIVGTRPEIIKMSPLLPRFDEQFEHVLIHSGQHYSAKMDAVFFEQLQLRAPDVALQVGSLPPGAQIAAILSRFEEVLTEDVPDLVVVQGDTNTALAGALAAAKHRYDGIRLAHVEAGMRSFQPAQPEELNRKLIDQMSDLLFVPQERDRVNALREGIDDERIVVSGNTVCESCLRALDLPAVTDILAQVGARRGAYVLATFHRQETVDATESLHAVCESLVELAGEVPVVVPLHPRAAKMIHAGKMSFSAPGLSVIEPVGYVEMMALLDKCRFLVTDSGGLQEEAAILGVSAVVLRDKTEHTSYVESGLHKLVGTDRDRIRRAIDDLLRRSPGDRVTRRPIRGEPSTSDIVVETIAALRGTATQKRPQGQSA